MTFIMRIWFIIKGLKIAKIPFTIFRKHVIIKNVKIKYTIKTLKKMALVKPFF